VSARIGGTAKLTVTASTTTVVNSLVTTADTITSPIDGAFGLQHTLASQVFS